MSLKIILLFLQVSNPKNQLSMKTIFKTFVFISILTSLTSCATKMITKSPQEVKAMTTKQYETNKSLVFKSAISLLQSESYLVEDANETTGLIRASKRIENKNAAMQRALWGSSKDANTSKVSIYIEDLNSELSEVKITLYEGAESTSSGYWGTKNKQNNESMVYEPEIYNNWFNSLRAEIERRKALTQ
jgi:predicted small lipoprotein YifL